MTTFVDRDSSMAVRRNEFLSDLLDVAKKHLAEHIPDAAADLVASSLTDHLTNVWGGQNINFPKDYHWKLSKRDQELYEAFNGHNYAELAKRYDMHERSVRRLINRLRARMQAAADARNRDLFND